MNVIEHSSLDKSVIPGIEHRTVAGSDLGSGTMEIWKQTLDENAETPVHYHNCEEVLILLNGTARMELEERTEDVSAPATVIVPPEEIHQLLNPVSEPLSLIGILSDTNPDTRAPDGSSIKLPW